MSAAPPVALDPQSRLWSLARGRRLPAAPAAAAAAARWAPGIGAVGSAGGDPVMASAAAGGSRLLLPLALIGVVLALSHFAFGRDTGCALLARDARDQARARHSTCATDAACSASRCSRRSRPSCSTRGRCRCCWAWSAPMLAMAALLRLAELESGDGTPSAAGWRRFAAVWKLIAIGLPLASRCSGCFRDWRTPLWGVPERAMARPGLSDRMSPGQWVDLLNDDTTALRVQFLGSDAATRRRCTGAVRCCGISTDAHGPSRRWLRGIPPAPVQSARTGWDYRDRTGTDRRAPAGGARPADRARRPAPACRWTTASTAPSRWLR